MEFGFHRRGVFRGVVIGGERLFASMGMAGFNQGMPPLMQIAFPPLTAAVYGRNVFDVVSSCSFGSQKTIVPRLRKTGGPLVFPFPA